MVSQKYSALSSELFLLSLSFGDLNLVNIEDIQRYIANLGPTLKTPLMYTCHYCKRKTIEFCKAGLKIISPKGWK